MIVATQRVSQSASLITVAAFTTVKVEIDAIEQEMERQA